MYQALIVAAGLGTRSGLDHNKNLHPLKNKPMIRYSVERFLEDDDCESIIVVCSENDKERFAEVLGEDAEIVIGGPTRQKSVANGLSLVSAKYVLIHDGARPNLKKDAITAIKYKLAFSDSVTLCVRVKDTLAYIEEETIVGSINRESVVQIQTPQAFLTAKIKQAHGLAEESGHSYPDDASLIRGELNEEVAFVLGDSNNIKATTADDFVLLEALL